MPVEIAIGILAISREGPRMKSLNLVFLNIVGRAHSFSCDYIVYLLIGEEQGSRVSKLPYGAPA